MGQHSPFCPITKFSLYVQPSEGGRHLTTGQLELAVAASHELVTVGFLVEVEVEVVGLVVDETRHCIRHAATTKTRSDLICCTVLSFSLAFSSTFCLFKCCSVGL